MDFIVLRYDIYTLTKETRLKLWEIMNDLMFSLTISLTYIRFNHHDRISYSFSYIILVPIVMSVFYDSIIVSKREIVNTLNV